MLYKHLRIQGLQIIRNFLEYFFSSIDKEDHHFYFIFGYSLSP